MEDKVLTRTILHQESALSATEAAMSEDQFRGMKGRTILGFLYKAEEEAQIRSDGRLYFYRSPEGKWTVRTRNEGSDWDVLPQVDSLEEALLAFITRGQQE